MTTNNRTVVKLFHSMDHCMLCREVTKYNDVPIQRTAELVYDRLSWLRRMFGYVTFSALTVAPPPPLKLPR